MSLRPYASIALLLVACGTGGGTTLAPATVGGTIKGATFTATDAIATNYTVTKNGMNGTLGFVAITTGTNTCDSVGMNQLHRGTQLLSITFATLDSMMNPTTAPMAGDYPIVSMQTNPPAGNVALVEYQQVDPMCGMPEFINMTSSVSGTLHLTSANANGYAGSGDVTLATGDHLTFSFIATTCTALATAMMSTNPPACI